MGGGSSGSREWGCRRGTFTPKIKRIEIRGSCGYTHTVFLYTSPKQTLLTGVTVRPEHEVPHAAVDACDAAGGGAPQHINYHRIHIDQCTVPAGRVKNLKLYINFSVRGRWPARAAALRLHSLGRWVLISPYNVRI